LRYADDAPPRQIGDMRLAEDGRQMMLAAALEADVAQHHHLVIAFDLLEGAFQHLLGVGVVAGEPFLIGAGDTARRVHQPLAVRIVAGPADQGTDGRLDLVAAWPRAGAERRVAEAGGENGTLGIAHFGGTFRLWACGSRRRTPQPIAS